MIEVGSDARMDRIEQAQNLLDGLDSGGSGAGVSAGTSAGALFETDLALRHAKQAGPHRYEFFSPRFNEQALSRLAQ